MEFTTGGSIMKCSKCNKEASYFIYHYMNDRRVEFVEARCQDHLNLELKERKKERSEIRKKRIGKFKKEKK